MKKFKNPIGSFPGSKAQKESLKTDWLAKAQENPKSVWIWDEIAGGWYVTAGDVMVNSDGWTHITGHGPVDEYRSEHNHLCLEVEAANVEEANELVLKHYKGDGYFADDDGKPFLAE